MAVNLEFENKLWEMADKLRGNIQPSDYKDVILVLIFLKYISDSFEEQYNKLVADGEGFEEEQDAYVEDNVFFVPPSARWEFIKKSAKQSIIGQIIDEAMIVIEKENKHLKGVLPKNYVRPDFDKTKLGELIDLFSFSLGSKESKAQDLLGRVYDPCCGSGGMFVQSAKFVEEHQGKKDNIHIYGQVYSCHLETLQNEPCYSWNRW